MMTFKAPAHFGFYATRPPAPPVQMVRVYCRKPGKPLEAFEAAGPINDAIAQVRAEGYPRAMVLASHRGD